MLVSDFLSDSAIRFPEKDFLVWRDRRISYGSMSRKVDALAAGLADEGLVAGDRVGLCMGNSPEYVLAYFGVMKAGAAVVPVSEQTTGRGLASIMSNCQASMLFIDRVVLQPLLGVLPQIPSLRRVIVAVKGDVEEKGVVERNQDLPTGPPDFCTLGRCLAGGKGGVVPCPTQEQELAMICYTSGTTGSPKGVMLTHRNLVANADSIVKYLHLTSDDKMMVVLPFYYSYGNSLLTTHAKVGGTLHIGRNFIYPNTVLELMVREGVTGFAGVPSTFAILLNRSAIRKYAFPTLRYLTQAGGAMSPRSAEELHRILPGTDIFIMYGQTEASARLTYLDPSDLHRKAGSAGKPIPGVRITIRGENSRPCGPREVGEIVAEGENIMKGYWGDPEGTARILRNDGLHTGDLAWKDEEGYIYIVGRQSEIIKSGGHRIGAKEIEEAILELPMVDEVAVVGEEDEILGESITAYIVPKERSAIDPQAIRRCCRERLPIYMVPRKVIFMGEFPKTISGKIKKNELHRGEG
jgi:acyl-CoA synthetase (AMP-forming)/AMP-acid ligase II